MKFFTVVGSCADGTIHLFIRSLNVLTGY